MKHVFNVHIENVHRIEVESDAPLSEVVDGCIDALVSGKLELGEPSMVRAEFWDDDSNEVGEIDGWGHRWVREEE